jgi:hypothetical protein
MPDTHAGLYVGYLPVPPGIRRALRVFVPTAAWLLLIVTSLWAWSQHDHDPGGSSESAAVWDQSTPRSFTGSLRATPVPMLITAPTGGDTAPRSIILLCEVGKRGAQQRTAGLDGASVKASGWLLQRDGRRILELEPGDGGLTVISPAATPEHVDAPGIRVTITGEIVDAKCFLGAMKPGEGKTHKECATLCIRGGIPAMLVHRISSGPVYTLLRSPDGGPLDSSIFPCIADPVEVTGTLEVWHDLRVLTLDPDGVRRL